MGLVTMLEKPHAVCIPFPAQGHINPMLKLAKLLHHKGFHITFVHTEFNHRRILKSQGPAALDGAPSFRFETIPDGLPDEESDPDATQDIGALCESTNNHCLAALRELRLCESTSKYCLAPFRELLFKLNDTASSNVPPVTCVVIDGAYTTLLTAAEELGIPGVLFWTSSTCSFMAFAHFQNFIDKGYTPLKDASYLTNGYLDTVIDWIPGMEGIRLKDIPPFIRNTDPNDFFFNLALSVVDNHHKASAIIINTFEKLDHGFLDPLSSMFPPIYTIGPVNLLLNQINDDTLNLIGSNLWTEEPECLEWLNSKEQNSVIYVNFGSITIMTPKQLEEFAWGLGNSNQTFLWIIRPDLVGGEMMVFLPEFLAATKERGLLASWCPQEKVLAHPSIGGFLTHCGWNSIMESFSSGVPMVCWPFSGDQLTNCWYICNKWGIGMEIDRDVKRDEVERLVRELIVGEKGKEMKRRALEWKELAKEATQNSFGSSTLNLDKLVNQVLLSPKH